MLNNEQIKEAYKVSASIIARTAAKYGRTLGADDVADLQQATLIRTLETFQADKGTLKTYVWKLAMNVTIDFLKGHTAESLDATDDEGTPMISEIGDDSGNAFAKLADAQAKQELDHAIAALPDGLARGIASYLDDDIHADGADRVAKHRAVAALEESLRNSHVTRSVNVRKATKNKRGSKVVADAPTEIPALCKLQTLSIWNYITSQKLVVVGPCEAPSPALSVDDGWAA